MATKSSKQQLILEIKAKTKQAKDALKKMGTSINKLSAKAKAFGASMKKVGAGVAKAFKVVAIAVTALVAAMTVAVIKAGKQEEQERKLAAALAITGQLTRENYDDLTKYASALQKVTDVGDEAILEIEALLVTFGATGDELKQLTELTIDMAKSMNMDMKAAALITGKAISGMASSLSRYGISVKQADVDTRGLVAVVEALSERFGGKARALAGTFTGRIGQMSNAFGDLVEEIGFAITKSEAVREVIQSLTKIFEDLGKKIADNRGKLLEFTKGAVLLMGSAAIRIIGAIAFIGKAWHAMAAIGNLAIAGIVSIASWAVKKISELYGWIADKTPSVFGSIKSGAQEMANVFSDSAENMEASGEKFFAKFQEHGEAFEKIKGTQEAINEEINTFLDVIRNMETTGTTSLDNVTNSAKKLKEAGEENIKTWTEIAAKMGMVQQVTSGTIGGIAVGVGAAVGGAAGAEVGKLVSIALDIVKGLKDLPAKLTKEIGVIVEGLIEGLPAVIDYFIGEFLTDVVPMLAEAIGRMIGELIKNLPSILLNVVKGAFVGVGKAIGGVVAGLFGKGWLWGKKTPWEKFVEKFGEAVMEMTENLKTIIHDVRASVLMKEPFELEKLITEEIAGLSAVKPDFIRDRTLREVRELFLALPKDFSDLLDLLIITTYDKTTRPARLGDIQKGYMTLNEAIVEGMEEQYDWVIRLAEAGKANEETIEDFSANMETAISVLNYLAEQEIMAIEEKYSKEIEAQQLLADAAEEQINSLKSLIESTKSSFDDIIQSVELFGLSTGEAVSFFENLYQSALAGGDAGAISAAGLDLAGALQSDFNFLAGEISSGYSSQIAAYEDAAKQGLIMQEYAADKIAELQELQTDELEELKNTYLDKLTELKDATVDPLQAMLELQEIELTEINAGIAELNTLMETEIATVQADLVTSLNNLEAILDAFESKMGSFQHGTNYVPETGLAIVHKGEAIIPANQNYTTSNVNLNIDARGSTNPQLTAEAVINAFKQAYKSNLGNIKTVLG